MVWVAALAIVMPRSRSSSIESILAPNTVLPPDVVNRVHPVRVVENPLGEGGLCRSSICAEIPILRIVARSLVTVVYLSRHGALRSAQPHIVLYTRVICTTEWPRDRGIWSAEPEVQIER